MTWTLNEVVDETRRILQDTVDTAPGGFRYENEAYITALNFGIIEMRRIRPDIFVGKYDQPLPKYTIAELDALPATIIALNDQWISPLTAYMAGWIETTDDEFTVDNRAGLFLQRFTTQLMMGG